MLEGLLKKIKAKPIIDAINNKKIKNKMIFLISMFSIFIIILGSISIWYMVSMNKSAEQMYENNMLANVYLGELSEKNLELEKLEVEYVLSNYNMDQSEIKNEIANVQASVPEIHQKLTSLQLSPYIVEKLKEYDEAVNITLSEHEKVEKRIEKKQQIEAYMYYQNRLSKERENLLTIINDMRDYNLHQSELTNQHNMKSASRAIMWMGIFVIFIITIATLLFIHIYRHIKNPINELSQEMEKVKNGDLNVSVKYQYDNELGTLSKHFIAMTSEINIMVQNMKKNAEMVKSSSSELLEGTTQMQQFSEHMATEVSDVSSQAETQVQHMNESVRAMEEVAKGIARINESAIEVSELSQRANQYANQGQETMQIMQSQMQSILKGSDDTYKAIEQFSETSNSIEKFVGTIEEIASQVQLLALNASIEAARAGEAGLGFAVVASEVRELADSTREASKSISRMVQSIQVQAKSAVQVVEKEQQEVSQGIKDISESEVIFRNITDAVQTINAQLQEVSASTEQMSASAQEVTSSLQEVSHLSEISSKKSLQVAALAKEQQFIMGDIKNNADDLDNVANNLNEEAEKFKSA